MHFASSFPVWVCSAALRCCSWHISSPCTLHPPHPCPDAQGWLCLKGGFIALRSCLGGRDFLKKNKFISIFPCFSAQLCAIQAAGPPRSPRSPAPQPWLTGTQLRPQALCHAPVACCSVCERCRWLHPAPALVPVGRSCPWDTGAVHCRLGSRALARPICVGSPAAAAGWHLPAHGGYLWATMPLGAWVRLPGTPVLAVAGLITSRQQCLSGRLGWRRCSLPGTSLGGEEDAWGVAATHPALNPAVFFKEHMDAPSLSPISRLCSFLGHICKCHGSANSKISFPPPHPLCFRIMLLLYSIIPFIHTSQHPSTAAVTFPSCVLLEAWEVVLWRNVYIL